MTAPGSTARPLRAIALACAALLTLILVPTALVAAGLPQVGYLLFFAVMLLWPVLALLGLAVHRLWRG